MKKICTITTLFIFFTVSFLPGALSSQHLDENRGHNQLLELARDRGEIPVIVAFNMPFRSVEHHNPEILAQQRAQIAITAERIIERYSFVEAENVQRYSNLPLMAFMANEAAIRALLADSDIRAVFKNELSAPSMDVSNAIIGSPVVWDAGVTGEGTVVAVLDTGVDSSHPHFGDRVIAEVCYSSAFDSSASSLCPEGATSAFGPGAADDCDFDNISGCGHGTHVAGTVAGSSVISGRQIQGVAKDAAIIAMQVFSRFDHTQTTICDSGSTPATRDCVLTYLSDQLAALNWLYDERSNYNLVAANMSLGGGGSTTPCDWDSRKAAMDNLKAVNIATIVASGNNGFSNGISSPACISTAISVGSTQTGKYLGTTEDNISSFSNSAHFLDLLAPGQFIENARPGNAYQAISGTSMAAPHVAGAWALYRQAFPNASVDEVLAALKEHGQLITDTRNSVTTARIQIDEAMLNTVTATEIPGTNQGWRILGSPVMDATYAEVLDGLWTQGFTGASVDHGTPNVYWYDEATRSYTAPDAASNIFGSSVETGFNNAGRGVLMFVYEDDFFDGTSTDWPKPISVVGIPHNREVEVVFTNTEIPGDTNQGWHFAANPFPYPINWTDLVDDNALEEMLSLIFIWDTNVNGGAGGYRVHYGYNVPNLPGDQAHDGILPAFQGFWVRTSGNESTGTITFRDDYATSGGTLFSIAETPAHIVLNVEGNNLSETALLSFNNGMETSTGKPAPLSAEPLRFGFFNEESERPDIFRNTEAGLGDQLYIPLDFASAESGSFRFNVSLATELEEVVEVILVDHETGRQQVLSNGDSYTFSYQAEQQLPLLEKNLSPEEILGAKSNLLLQPEQRFELIVQFGSATDIEGEQDLPTTMKLHQNYPNPFNPTTQISYDLPESADVRLEVYNIQGQRVATLVNATQNAGTHSITIDAGNLASGVYLYRLRAGNTVLTQKMTLVK